jgi:V8-like Glu-specific endopeptidase
MPQSYQSSPETPLSFEHTLKLENVPDKDLPEAVKRELSTPKIYLRGIAHRRDVDDYLTSVEDIEATWSIRLPRGASVGLPGRTGERLDRASVALAEGSSTDPHRPSVEQFYGIYNNPDARQVFYPQDYPWRCTGRIFTYTSWPTPNWSWWGSGVLIGPRHVLTAGHVAPWGSQTWAMLFVPAYWDGASVYGAGASSYVSDFRGWNTGGSVAAHDISVLRLYQPLGNQLGWMGSRTYDGAWEGGNYWTLTGYPGAIAGAQRPAYQSGVAVLDDDEDSGAQEIEHHGDSSAGESGGPMYGFWNDGPHAIGTTSGGETISGGFLGIGDEDNNIAAGGNAMVDLVKWALSNWP